MGWGICNHGSSAGKGALTVMQTEAGGSFSVLCESASQKGTTDPTTVCEDIRVNTRLLSRP